VNGNEKDVGGGTPMTVVFIACRLPMSALDLITRHGLSFHSRELVPTPRKAFSLDALMSSVRFQDETRGKYLVNGLCHSYF
jgi:hypothetical protein